MRFEAAFPNHRTVELPGANHFFFEDNAPQLVRAMRAFVDSDRAAAKMVPDVPGLPSSPENRVSPAPG